MDRKRMGICFVLLLVLAAAVGYGKYGITGKANTDTSGSTPQQSTALQSLPEGSCVVESGGRPAKSMVSTAGELSDEEHPRIALTFDDGPHPVFTPKLLDGLKKRGIHATFFLIGKNIDGNEELVKRIQEEGHLIGSHTYNHVQLGRMTETKAKDEVLKGCNKIYETTGVYSSFVRPPYGDWKKNLDFCITMIPVSWNVDSLDWKIQNTKKIVKRVVKDVQEGDIILMHDIFDTSVDAALEITDALTKEGYNFVTVDELLLE